MPLVRNTKSNKAVPTMHKTRIENSLMLLLFLLPAGCSPEYYRADADKEVYRIIDTKWKDDFGSKANYKIEESSQDPCAGDYRELLPESGLLSLKDAVALATRMNRSYLTQKEQLYLAALNLTLERWRYTPRLFGMLGGTYQYTDDQNESWGGDGTLGLNYLLADGTEVGLSVASDWLRYLSGDSRTSISSVLTATIRKPLWRASERKVVQENLVQAERDALYAIRSFNRFRKEFVVSVISEYYRLLQSLQEVKNAENDYKNRKIFEDQAVMMAQTGRWPQFQVDEARQRTLSSQVNLVQAQQNYKAQLDRFKIRTLSLPATVEIHLDPNELRALEAVGVTEIVVDEEETIATALANRLDLRNEEDQVEDARRKVEVAIDNLKGDLNLSVSTNNRTNRQSNGETIQFSTRDMALGLDLDLPLDRKSERNAYRRSLIALEQQQRDYALFVDEVKLDVRQALRDLQEAADTYRIQVESLKLAQRRVDMTMLLLQEGRSDIEELLRSQDSLLLAQNAVSRALINHAIARLNFLRDIGILQVRPDGFWEQANTVLAHRNQGKNNQTNNRPAHPVVPPPEG